VSGGGAVTWQRLLYRSLFCGRYTATGLHATAFEVKPVITALSPVIYTGETTNFVVCILLCVMSFLGRQQIYQKLNQSNITVLHWFHLVTATCFDPYLDHPQVVFLNTSLVIELS
jgi:high-affinity K+ transport system ATPase subunit B